MPETREKDGHLLLFEWIINQFGLEAGCLAIQALYADATEAEASSIKATDGLVRKLDAHCLYQRGNPSDRGDLFPPQLRITPENPNPLPVTCLELLGVVDGSRAVALNLKYLWLQVCLS